MRWVTGIIMSVVLVGAVQPLGAQRTVQGTPTDLLPPSMRGETEPPPSAAAPKSVQKKISKRPAAEPARETAQSSSPTSIDLPPSSVEQSPVQPLPVPTLPDAQAQPASWTIVNAQALLGVIKRIGGRGLMPADYASDELEAAIATGEGDALNAVATDAFTMLGKDLRDGRTPKSARIQWIVRDTDAQNMPIRPVLDAALASGEIGEALASLEPAHPDYARLLDVLDKTPATDKAKLQLIRTNLDRWRWMPQSLGARHLFANVPEYTLRVFANRKVLAHYPVIVGKRNTQTPSLDAVAQGVVVHPPWYLPRSIINESVGALIARSPAVARARGYTWTGSGKTLSVVQQPGPTSALGVIKVDMPNAESIFIHDTPSRHLFGGANKALSHGCLRTDRAMELGILLGIMQAGGSAEELAELIKKGKTEKVPFKENIPVFISYFTMGTGVDGTMRVYDDLYGRDAAVVASFAKPRSALTPAPIPAPPLVAVR
jgi:L,D-transpeptidase YcbB